jgi:hypothetical protein
MQSRSDHAVPRSVGRAERDRYRDLEAKKSDPSEGKPPRMARSLTRRTARSFPQSGKAEKEAAFQFLEFPIDFRCRGWDSNPYATFATADFKSAASTVSPPRLACDYARSEVAAA